MRTRLLAIFLLIASSIPALAGLPPMSAEKWREDLGYFATEAPKRHKNLFHTMTREQFEAVVRQLDGRIAQMNDDQIVVELARIVAMIRDGHTYMRLGWAPLDYPRLPIRMEVLSDGMVVRAADPRYAQLVGGKVVSIGGRNADEVLKAVSELAPRDNDMTILARVPRMLSTPALLHGLGLVEDTAEVSITVEKGGKTVNQAVASQALPPESRHTWVPNPSWAMTAGDRLPLWLRHPDDIFWYEFLPDSRTLYVQWNAVQNKKDETVAHFFQRVFDFANTTPVNRLVLDLRLNGGGNNYLNTEPIKAILRSPLNQRGKFFVLIGPRTFSAAQNLTNILHKYSEAIWIGMPTGGSPNSFGDPVPLTLPNSKIQVYLSVLWWQDLDERDKRAWQAPDVAVQSTVKDFANGQDPVMDAVLHWQNKPSLDETVRAAAKRKDYPAIAAAYRAFRADPANKYADFEKDFNNLGYEFLTAGDTAAAIEILKLNVEVYPRSWNAYDSLGEAYMKAGKKDLAIANYEKSLQLNPENQGGQAALRHLRLAN